MAFWTFPALRHFVQTYARCALPCKRTRTRWRLGSKRRFVATIEWLRWWPKLGFFPQIAQILDIPGRDGSGSALGGLGRRPELLEDVGHLERRPHRVRPPLGRVARLGQDAEGDRDAGLERGELEPRRGLARDDRGIG